MGRKIVTHYTYEGLGFAIELRQVEMVKINNEWHPKIDVRKIADATIQMLVTQKERLTGNQIKFIRSYYSMTLRDFAKNVVNVSHTAVNKWEKFENKVTNMDINIEKILRLYIYETICMKTAKQKNEFYKKYLALKQITTSSTRVSHLTLSVACV